MLVCGGVYSGLGRLHFATVSMHDMTAARSGVGCEVPDGCIVCSSACNDAFRGLCTVTTTIILPMTFCSLHLPTLPDVGTCCTYRSEELGASSWSMSKPPNRAQALAQMQQQPAARPGAMARHVHISSKSCLQCHRSHGTGLCWTLWQLGCWRPLLWLLQAWCCGTAQAWLCYHWGDVTAFAHNMCISLPSTAAVTARCVCMQLF